MVFDPFPEPHDQHGRNKHGIRHLDALLLWLPFVGVIVALAAVFPLVVFRSNRYNERNVAWNALVASIGVQVTYSIIGLFVIVV